MIYCAEIIWIGNKGFSNKDMDLDSFYFSVFVNLDCPIKIFFISMLQRKWF